MSREDMCILTYTGRIVNPFYPNKDSISIEDIAHSLAMQCRFNGHISKFYSVAEHCVYVALILRKLGCSLNTQLLGLLHDSTEAYLADIPAPVKDYLDDYLILEQKLEEVILETLNPLYKGFSVEDYSYVDFVDEQLSIFEGKFFMGGAIWDDADTIINISSELGWSPVTAKQLFVALYYFLLEEALF